MIVKVGKMMININSKKKQEVGTGTSNAVKLLIWDMSQLQSNVFTFDGNDCWKEESALITLRHEQESRVRQLITLRGRPRTVCRIDGQPSLIIEVLQEEEDKLGHGFMVLK